MERRRILWSTLLQFYGQPESRPTSALVPASPPGVRRSFDRRTSFEDPKIGWVESIGVRRPWRRRGLALALLHHSFLTFYHRGQESVGLSVDASSLTGATRLYEKAGMHVVRRLDNYEKELRPGTDISVQAISQS